jgi:hypothetical protein
MSIRIQIKGRVFIINFGYYKKWFSQMHFITIIEEFYDSLVYEPTYAKMIWRSWK